MGKDPKSPTTWVKTSDQYGYYKIQPKEQWGYSSIDFAMNLVFQCIALYISFFYTDIFGLKPGHVSILFLVSRFWDAVNDPMMGTIVERLSPKKGKEVKSNENIMRSIRWRYEGSGSFQKRTG